MRAVEFITEDVGPNLLYHGVPDGNTVSKIIKSGFIKPHPAFDFDREQDVKRGEKPLDRISLTRDQYLHFPYGRAVAQFVIDRDALKRYGYKIRPTVGFNMPSKYETEELVYKDIPVRLPFVIELQYDPNLEIPKNLLQQVQKIGIKLNPWRKTKRDEPESVQQIEKLPAKSYDGTPWDIDKLQVKPVVNSGYEVENGEVVRKEYPPTEWYIGYTTEFNPSTKQGGTYVLAQNSKDKNYMDKLYAQIKDRILKGLTWYDLLPQDKYGRDWKQGSYKLKHGTPEYDKA
jgi:hypothetical protein